MTSQRKIMSIGISGILTLDSHDLNNQGSEGNLTLERTAPVITANGEIQIVNAISGDMVKHSISNYANAIAKEENLPLCVGCKNNSANRINMENKGVLRKDGNSSAQSEDEEEAEVEEESEETSKAKGKKSKKAKKSDNGKFTDAELSDKIIQLCVGDDLCGIMITEKAITKGFHRKGCFECGMILGIPDKVETVRDFHVKFSKEDAGGDGGNKGQNIFHRPNNSGMYASVMYVDADHVGRNDFTNNLAISEEEQKKRLSVLLKSIASTYVNFMGAQRNTQMPHVVDFKGSISISYSKLPAPTISPINENFTEEIKNIAIGFNKFSAESIKIIEFDSVSKFVDIMSKLMD